MGKQVVLTIEMVDERRKTVMDMLSKGIKSLYSEVYKDSATVAQIKKFNKFLQNRDGLKSLMINTSNYEYINKTMDPIEKEIKSYLNSIKKKNKEESVEN